MGTTAQVKMLDSRHGTRDCFQSLLTAGASIILSGFIMLFATVIRDIAAEHASGLAAIAGGMLEGITTPYGWLAFLASFTFFYVTSHSSKTWVRRIFFWIPACLAIALGFAVWAVMVHASHGMPR